MFDQKRLNTDKRIIRFIIAIVLLIVVVISYYLNPANYKITDCSFKHLTGISCPGCGLSRSFHSIAHLELIEAFQFHLLGPVFFIGLAILSLWMVIESITGKSFTLQLLSSKWKVIIYFTLGFWFHYWVIRMILEIYVLSV